MNIEWCSDTENSNATCFNTVSFIVETKQKAMCQDPDVNPMVPSNPVPIQIPNSTQTHLKPNNAIISNNTFDVINMSNIINMIDMNDISDITTMDKRKLLTITSQMSSASNYLRTLIREKATDNIELTIGEYANVQKYLQWIYNVVTGISKYFLMENSHNHETKLFKTSSYKFCNSKNTCQAHFKSNYTCPKHHFPIQIMIKDMNNLLQSLDVIGIDGLNWLLTNKHLHVEKHDNKYTFNKIICDTNTLIENTNDNYVLGSNNVIKSFDVVSFVLKKMYDELVLIYTPRTNANIENIKSCLIDL